MNARQRRVKFRSYRGRDAPGRRLDGHVRMLWHANYWDGPISGYVEVDGVPGFWADCGGPDDVRVFTVYRLTDEQDRLRREHHEVFRAHVGVHTDYDRDGRRQIGALRPREEWAKYYDAKLPEAFALTPEQVIGTTRRLFPRRAA